jgi:hypothetical protein
VASTNVNVSVSDDHLDHFEQVVRELEETGLNVEQQLEAVGIVSGSIDSAKLEDLRKVNGVAAVEPSRNIQLEPPSSDVQ